MLIYFNSRLINNLSKAMKVYEDEIVTEVDKKSFEDFKF